MEGKLIKKICLLGDNAVGKTSLIRKYVYDTFDDKYIATIGTKTTKKEMTIEYFNKRVNVTMMIWDVLGQHDYRNIHERSFKGTSGAMLVCDVTRPDTLEGIKEYWLPALEKVAGNVPLVFLANKIDLKDDAKFGEKEIRRIAEEHQGFWSLTSAKTGENVDGAFYELGAKVIMPNFEMDNKYFDRRAEKSLTPAEGLDMIMAHFCDHIGQEQDFAMSIIREQAKKIELDVIAPSKQKLFRFVQNLYDVDRSFKSPEEARKFRIERTAIVDSIR